MPDTPEDDSLPTGEPPCSDELLRLALRRSSESGLAVAGSGGLCHKEQGKQRGDTAAAAAVDCNAVVQSRDAAAHNPCTDDVNNMTCQQQPASLLAAPKQLHRPSGLSAPPPQQQHKRQHEEAVAQPMPQAQQQQRRHPHRRTSFLAGAKAALLEASAPGSQPGAGSPSPAAPRLQSAARLRQAPQLALRRSPLAALAVLPPPPSFKIEQAASLLLGSGAGVVAAPLADKTPQAQLGLRRTPVSGQAPPTGSTDGGTSGTSGGWFFIFITCCINQSNAPLLFWA